MANKAIEQIEFKPPANPEAPQMFYDQAGGDRWLLVVDVCNVVWKTEHTPELIKTLRAALEMVEKAEGVLHGDQSSSDS